MANHGARHPAVGDETVSTKTLKAWGLNPAALSIQDESPTFDTILTADNEVPSMADCGCGRSPTGQCIGWHNLSEEEYQQKLKEHQEKKAQESADKD